MKNQVIKKIMAYLLAGAMIVTTPMVAFADEIADAFSGGEGLDSVQKNTSTKSGTSTSTNTDTEAVDLPGAVDANLADIVGVSLDKTSLELAQGERAWLRARALFNGELPDEEMAWATISQANKDAIEKTINWFSEDYSIATIVGMKDPIKKEWTDSEGVKHESNDLKEGPTAEIMGVNPGVTTIYAWIEADNQQYVNAPYRPTPGDFVATATVTVTAGEGSGVEKIKIEFNDEAVSWVIKRQYDLKEYTTLKVPTKKDANGKWVITDVPAGKYSGSVVYGVVDLIPDSNNKKPGAKLTDNGILTMTGNPGATVRISITAGGVSTTADLVLIKPNPVKQIKLTTPNQTTPIIVDMGAETDYNSEKNRVEKAVEVTITPEDTSKPTTDDIMWILPKKTTVGVTDIGGIINAKQKATILPTDFGKTTVTVKATSGKSCKITVDVIATPDKVVLETATTYTGKPVTLSAKLYGKNDKVLPLGKTKLAYSLTNVVPTGDNKNTAESGDKKVIGNYASINGKGIVTPKILLSTNKGETYAKSVALTAKVEAKLNNKPISTDTNKSASEAVVTVKQGGFDKDALKINVQHANGKEFIKWDNTLWNKGKLTLSDVFVGNTYKFVPYVKDSTDNDMYNSIVWASKGKDAVSKADGVNYESAIKGSATATITAKYIELDPSSGKTKASVKTQTITLKPIQMAKTLVLDKPVQVVTVDKNSGNTVKADKKVTVKVKALDPKNSKDTIDWKVLSADDTNNQTEINKAVADKVANPLKAISDSLATDKKAKAVTVTVPKGTKAGSVIKVGAYASGGAVAYAYIYVTNPADAIGININGSGVTANTYTLPIDKTATISATMGQAQLNPKSAAKWTLGETSAYENGYVTYTLDKKSATIISVDKNGNITPKKIGTAKVKVQNISGGKAVTLTINVDKPSEPETPATPETGTTTQ